MFCVMGIVIIGFRRRLLLLPGQWLVRSVQASLYPSMPSVSPDQAMQTIAMRNYPQQSTHLHGFSLFSSLYAYIRVRIDFPSENYAAAAATIYSELRTEM